MQLKKALIVDDSSVMRKIIAGVLSQSFGLTEDNIIHAADGKEGLDAAQAHSDLDLIFMDWNMPNMLGIESVEAIRAAGIKTPIMMVTTEAEKVQVIKAIQAGATNYLAKPFNVDDLRIKIEQMLSGAPA